MVKKTAHKFDPRGLIGDCYAIDGIREADCRSIFFDWALGLSSDVDAAEAARTLLAFYSEMPTEHPMSRLLADATKPKLTGRRRGRRRAD